MDQARASEEASRSRRRRLWIFIALAFSLVLLVAAGYIFTNGLPLPITARDKAILITARDLEPWIPGLSSLEGSESFSKRRNFFWSPGNDTEYRFESLKAGIGLYCTVTTRPSDGEAANTFNSLKNVAPVAVTLLRFGKLLDRSFPSPSLTIRDEALRLGDSSHLVFFTPGDISGTSFVARKGPHVLTLFLVGPRIDEDGLRKLLSPRFEALARI